MIQRFEFTCMTSRTYSCNKLKEMVLVSIYQELQLPCCLAFQFCNPSRLGTPRSLVRTHLLNVFRVVGSHWHHVKKAVVTRNTGSFKCPLVNIMYYFIPWSFSQDLENWMGGYQALGSRKAQYTQAHTDVNTHTRIYVCIYVCAHILKASLMGLFSIILTLWMCWTLLIRWLGFTLCQWISPSNIAKLLKEGSVKRFILWRRITHISRELSLGPFQICENENIVFQRFWPVWGYRSWSYQIDFNATVDTDCRNIKVRRDQKVPQALTLLRQCSQGPAAALCLSASEANHVHMQTSSLGFMCNSFLPYCKNQ